MILNSAYCIITIISTIHRWCIMKRIKIIPRPKPDGVLVPQPPPPPPIATAVLVVKSDEKEHARDMEINNLKDDISNLKKSLWI